MNKNKSMVSEDIGTQIKYWREKRKLTQTELAEKIGVANKSVIYRYESGRRSPSIETMEKIAKALNCKMNIYFIEDNQDK